MATIGNELLERIRDIRSSEKVFYRQLLDHFATSIDPKPEECRQFFQIGQNKQTSAEIIYSRANAELPFMGRKTFSGEHPNKEDTMIAKNYLDEKELSVLNRMVSAFFDLAELHAMNHEREKVCCKENRILILQMLLAQGLNRVVYKKTSKKRR